MSGNPTPGASLPVRPPNIVTIVLDCARAKNFALSGGGRIAPTPVIDALAAEGTAFPRAVAPSNWTVPSHYSLFTGSYPNVHGYRTYQKVTDRPESTAEHLKNQGYETSILTENIHLVGGYGLEAGFENQVANKGGISDDERTVVTGLFGGTEAIYRPGVLKLLERIPPLVAPLSWMFHSQEVSFKQEVCGQMTVDHFSDWLGRRSPEKPFYSFFNFVDTHDPYGVVENGQRVGWLGKAYLYAPRSYLLAVPGLQERAPWEAMVGDYLRTITAADAKVGQLLRALERHGERDRTMVVVTSDHGQSFGEHGNVYHGTGATDSVTRVPLVVAPPKGVPVPKRVERWVSLCEVDSWIRAAAAGLPPFDSAGRAPYPFSTSAPDSRVVYCEGAPASDSNRSLRKLGANQSWNHRLLAAYREDEKFVLDLDTGDLLRWPMGEDPDRSAPTTLQGEERANLRQDVFGPYEAQESERRAKASAGPAPVDIDVEERLRSWGYI
ncbi:MAG: sulfatase [Thermoplasmata archaeon]|nr:sulfatase [Thermoplasmata archaeon]